MLDTIFDYKRDADLNLSTEQEADLLAAAQAGDDTAMLTLMQAYGPAIRAAVANFGKAAAESGSLDLDDLRSTALAGFIKAVHKYDGEKANGKGLAGIVKPTLVDELTKALPSASPVNVPERTRRRYFTILAAADHDPVAAANLAPSYSLARDTFINLHAIFGTVSMDEASSVSGEATRHDEATSIFNPSAIADAEDAVLCELAFSAVDDTEERICRLSYGFTEYDPVPDAEIGHRIGMTRPTVQRHRANALRKMRESLAAGDAL